MGRQICYPDTQISNFIINMKKVLVTGATGFIGDYVIQELLKRSVSVVASSSNEKKAVTKSWFNKVIYIPLDFTDINSSADYYSYFEKPDNLIHLTWEGLPNYKSAFHKEENFPRHLTFLQNMIKNGLKNVTVTGTCFEYGMRDGQLREDMPVSPSNPYAIAKNDLRIALEKLQSDYNFLLKWVRLFYMYGKGQNPNSLLSQLERALLAGDNEFKMSGGEQVRDFMPVEEVASAIVKISLQDSVIGIINCCSGNPVSVIEFVKNYLKEYKKDIKLNLGYYPYPDFEPMRFWGDNSKLKMINNNE